MRNLGTECDIHPALALDDTGEYTINVFARLLDIFFKAAFIKFQCLENVARLPLVANAYGYDVEFGECFYLVERTAEAEHLYDTLVCMIIAVLSAAVALSNPNGLLLTGNVVAYIFG